MRDIVVALELQHLGIDQDQAALGRREAIEQRQEDTVQPHRLTRPGCARDEQVGHGGEIGDDRFARDILAQDHGQIALGLREIFRFGQFLERDRLAVGIGQFDTDHGLARNRGYARADRGHVAGDIFGEAHHAAGLDARRGFQLVHGHDRAGAHRHDLALDVEIVEHVFEQAGVPLQRHLVELRDLLFTRIGEEVEAGQIVFGKHVALAGLGRRFRPPRRGRGIGDFGCAAGRSGLFRKRFGSFFGSRAAFLAAGEGEDLAVGDLVRDARGAAQEFGQSQELHPVDREDARDQRPSAEQCDDPGERDDPARRAFGEAPCHGLDPARAQQAREPAEPGRKPVGAAFEYQREHGGE